MKWRLFILKNKVAISIKETGFKRARVYIPKDVDIKLTDDALIFRYCGEDIECRYKNYLFGNITPTIPEMQKLGLSNGVSPSVLCFVYDLLAAYRLSMHPIFTKPVECNPSNLMNFYPEYKKTLAQRDWNHILQQIRVPNRKE